MYHLTHIQYQSAVMASQETVSNPTIVDYLSDTCDSSLVGGKARNLWLLGRLVECKVPQWYCVTTEGFSQFVQVRPHDK